MAKATAAQQKVLDGLKAGKALAMRYTKYPSGEEFYHSGEFNGENRVIPYKTILALARMGLIKEASREESPLSHATTIIVYQLAEQATDEVSAALISEGGYKGFRLQYDEQDSEWFLQIWSKTYGWDYLSTNGSIHSGTVRSYKSLNRGIKSALAEISKRNK